MRPRTIDHALAENVRAFRHKPPEHWFCQDLLFHRGRAMTPVPRPQWIRPSRWTNPFAHAANVVLCETGRKFGLRYAEGFVLTQQLPWPVHHAWVTLPRKEGRCAIEVTWDDPAVQYKGIVVDADRLAQWRERRMVSLLYDARGRVNWRFMSVFMGKFIVSEYPYLASHIRMKPEDSEIMAEGAIA